jgi:hypothetical protein
MFLLMRKSIRSCSLASSLLLAFTLLFPPKLFGADQPVSEAEPASLPVQSVPLTEQPASQPEQTVPQAEPVLPPKEPAPPAAPPPKPKPRPRPQVITEQETDGFESLDGPRNYVSEKIIGFASSMDRFFGGNRHYQESNQSVLRLDLTRIVGYGDNHKFDLSGKINLKLPGTEGRVRLWLESDPEDEIYDDPTKDTHTLQNRPAAARSTGLAARYKTSEEKALRFTTDAGIKLPITQLDPFARAKAEYSMPIDEWRMKVAESVYWFNTLGVGETTQLDLERVLSPSRLFRSSSNITWLRDRHNYDLVHSFSVYHTVNNRSALIYQVSANWITNPSFRATDYVALVYYRYRMHQKWLFLEMSPQLHFPWEKKYKDSAAFSLRLEALFDESK